MAINLEVIGIFFKCQIDEPGPRSVEAILNAAALLAAEGSISGISQFSYAAQGGIITNLSCVRTKNTTGRVTSRIYGPGVYSLTSSPDLGTSYNVWQYYVLNADGTRAVTGFRPYNSGEPIVPDGGSLIWRLVSILKGYPPLVSAAE